MWAIGDGAYAFAARRRELGPFADNQPPYLALRRCSATRQPAHVEAAPAGCRDGRDRHRRRAELAALARSTEPRSSQHADRARRELAVLARGREAIDWDDAARRAHAAVLHDDVRDRRR